MEKYENVIMVRSPKALIGESKIGYGWSNVNFSKYKNEKELFSSGFKDIDVGRKTNQIKNYYNLYKGNLVIVPLSGAISLAEVIGEKSFSLDTNLGENQINVKFLINKDGNVAYIPRKTLSTALQSRLKLRMAIADLIDFSDEINLLTGSLEKGEAYTWEQGILEKEEKAKNQFKEDLLERIQDGKDTAIQAGGYGLEVLIQELLCAQGYNAKIPSKNSSSGIEDIDIIAKRSNLLTNDIETLLIQVKHHKGKTNDWGLKQLEAYKVDNETSHSRKVLITTGNMDNKIRERAEVEYPEIVILEGNQFIDWLYENLTLIEESTRIKLGISNIPSLV